MTTWLTFTRTGWQRCQIHDWICGDQKADEPFSWQKIYLITSAQWYNDTYMPLQWWHIVALSPAINIFGLYINRVLTFRWRCHLSHIRIPIVNLHNGLLYYYTGLTISLHWWHSTRLQYLQCISIGDYKNPLLLDMVDWYLRQMGDKTILNKAPLSLESFYPQWVAGKDLPQSRCCGLFVSFTNKHK